MPDLPTVDSTSAVSSLQDFLGEFGPQARESAQRLKAERRVLKIGRRNDQVVTANVFSDARIFPVELHRDQSGWKSVCTCRLDHCEHAAALAMTWLGTLGNSVVAPVAAGAPGLPAVEPDVGSPKLSFRQQWQPVLEEKMGRPLTEAEGAFLGKLSMAFHNFRQSRRLSGKEVRQLGFDTIESRRTFGLAYEGWWETPPGDPWALWQYLAYDIEVSGFQLPDFILPLTDTSKIRARLGDKERRETVQRWSTRFRQLADRAERAAAAPAAEPEVAQPLELRLKVNGNDWTLETRPGPESAWKTATGPFLDRLIAHDAVTFTRIEASPATYAFLALCQEYQRIHYTMPLAPGVRGGGQLVHQLLSHRLARTLVVDPAGKPLGFSAAPLAWNLVRSSPGDLDYELSLTLPNGQRLPPAAAHLPGRPDYYLHGNIVYPGPPSLDGLSATAAVVPGEVIERPEVLRMLRELGTKFPPEIESKFISVPMRAQVECALEFDFSGNEILSLRFFAVSDQPPVRRAWQGQAWEAPVTDEPGTTELSQESETGKIHTFDLAQPRAVAGRLAELKLSYDEYRQRWTRRVTRSFPDEFLAWRESLPPGVEVIATGELASLLGATVRATVAFDLLETEAHRDWFDLALALKPEDTTLTPSEIALLLKARGKLVRLPGKGWKRLDVQIEGGSAAALQAAGFELESVAEAALAGDRQRFHALQLAQSAIADHLPERQAETLRSHARALVTPEPPAVPAGLRAELRAYQVEGFHFLAFLSANRLGGVLADDMGLGKTLQALAWLLWLSEKPRGEIPFRALVVCPKSVVGNWDSETARFAPALRVVRFAPLPRKEKEKAAAGPGQPTIVVANYVQLRLSADYFQSQRWDAVILDEGQFIKTPSSKVAQVARDLPGEHRLILTGTPIENRLLDLWSLFAFSLPGLLGSQAAFKRQYAQDNPLALTRLRARVRHFLLRRTKSQVAADLPARTEEDVTVELEGVQLQLYQAELKRARAELLKLETARELGTSRFNILASLLRLRQICCHPALIDPVHRAEPSAKLDELIDRLEELRAEGHQVLVFSQFVEMLGLIRERLVTAEIGHLMLTGQTENREELVNQFQSEKNQTVFLLSLKAAGFGLNLTAASYVFLYDPWWNPAVEAQAIDRTHRIGQTSPVNAYRLVARGTIEEKIRLLQREKAALANAIVQEESLANVLDLDSLRMILA